MCRDFHKQKLLSLVAWLIFFLFPLQLFHFQILQSSLHLLMLLHHFLSRWWRQLKSKVSWRMVYQGFLLLMWAKTSKSDVAAAKSQIGERSVSERSEKSTAWRVLKPHSSWFRVCSLGEGEEKMALLTLALNYLHSISWISCAPVVVSLERVAGASADWYEHDPELRFK